LIAIDFADGYFISKLKKLFLEQIIKGCYMVSASEHSMDSSLADNAQEAMFSETFRHYSSRFIVLGLTIAFLAIVVLYLYQNKVAAPMDGLENDVETQVITEPVLDNNSGYAPTAASALEKAAPTELASYTPEAPPLYRGHAVECPVGTNRMIYIDDQALCCHGSVCNEPK
jgi:hypothetical protein